MKPAPPVINISMSYDSPYISYNTNYAICHYTLYQQMLAEATFPLSVLSSGFHPIFLTIDIPGVEIEELIKIALLPCQLTAPG